ncbi:MAG: PA0069 family radical SAM protein [Alphaproteobacteria bacterium GM202ARS2]|nr:PA0069 family radical SAM protein [Alphaproteobacteria bacterium GM202ARS2]
MSTAYDKKTRNTTPKNTRGTSLNPHNRYERLHYDSDGDSDNQHSDTPTSVFIDKAKSVLTRQRSPDIPFEWSLNPYRGCEHGCIYCYARPSHEYLGLSAGIDFESKLFVKPNAADSLARELDAPAYRCSPIALGSNTDPYQPIERKLRITRAILETLLRYRHPVTITTKSDLILRDSDILQPLAKMNLLRVFVSITTLDGTLARRMEPRAPTIAKRLQAMQALHQQGIHVTAMLAPLIPGLNDDSIESILRAAHKHGAQQAYYVLLRLPSVVADLWHEWLQTHYPDKAGKVRSLVRSTRQGKDNDSRFGHRMRGNGAYADMLAQRFQLAKQRYGLDGDFPPLTCALFQPTTKQNTLFDG